MKWSIEHKALTGFAVALAIIATIGWLAYQSTVNFMHASTQATHSQEIITDLEEIFSLTNQAETQQRIYLIDGDERHLAPRHAYIDRMRILLGKVRDATVGNPGQQALLRRLDEHIDARLVLLDGVLKVRREQGFEQARIKLMAGNSEREMVAIHETVEQLQKEETARLQQLADVSRANSDRMLTIFIVALVSVAIFFGVLFLFIVRELAERRRTEEALQQSSARIDMLLNSVAEGIYGVDMQGNCTFINPAGLHLLGYQDETELLGKHMHELIHHTRADGSHYPAAECRLYCCLHSHENIHVDDELFWRKDGSSFMVDYWSRPIVSNVEVNGAVVTFFDITERKQAEEQQVRLLQELESANEELRNFGYVVSHDLKAPLRAIGSLANWLSADYADKFDDEGKEHMRLLISRVYRMDGLIDGILQYSRVGRVKETIVAVDLDRLVHEVIDLLAPPPSIVVTIENPLPTVMTEPTRIQQVFQNLLSNAIKYMDKPEGEIRIACVAVGRQWRFSITDNGPGIDQQHFEKIFQLFQTLSPRDRVESTGVGLALVKKIVEMYGGRIWLESTVGQGSTFFFTLPRTA